LFPACAAAAPSGEYAVGESPAPAPAPAPVMVIVYPMLCCAVLLYVAMSWWNGSSTVSSPCPVSSLTIANLQSPICRVQSIVDFSVFR
jgi:branched-subunit amino acid permease